MNNSTLSNLKKEISKFTNPEKAKAIFSDEDREIVTTLHNGWKGFLSPFMLPVDYKKRTISIDDYLKSGSPDEVYGLAGVDAGGILRRLLSSRP